ncbi:MAG TPA: MFS transporter [Solirubrobacteraceae bacterium]|nr:MFS transporter [Solirubrobacteraceae bacterium]
MTPSGQPGPTSGPRASAGSAWAPLREPTFRAMWAAQFGSNVGSWMQTVGAQWLMSSLTVAAAPVALIQTASSLPVLLFALLAGVLGDLLDRRRLILACQTAMLAASVCLAGLTLAGRVTPVVLLALIFAIGVGNAFAAPVWQTLQPELVPSGERPDAIALGAVNQNLARAVGPALGGALLAAVNAGAVFLANAVSFLGVLAVVARARIPDRPHHGSPEHVVGAMRAGGRFILASGDLRVLLIRATLFIVPASAVWALLPVLARRNLGLGSAGYGLLLGGVGIGAIIGATLLPVARRRLGPDRLLAASTGLLCAATLVLGLTASAWIAGASLVGAGLAWICALALFNSSFQGGLPGWVKSRALAYYLVVFQGGMALGSAAFGGVAGAAGVKPALLASAGLLAAGLLAAAVLRLPSPDAGRIVPAELPMPELDAEPSSDDGPVFVTVGYEVDLAREEEFFNALPALRAARRRTGAIQWRAMRDAASPHSFLETYVVADWTEHERQHGRMTRTDHDALDAATAATTTGRRVVHHLTPASRPTSRSQ